MCRIYVLQHFILTDTDTVGFMDRQGFCDALYSCTAHPFLRVFHFFLAYAHEIVADQDNLKSIKKLMHLRCVSHGCQSISFKHESNENLAYISPNQSTQDKCHKCVTAVPSQET